MLSRIARSIKAFTYPPSVRHIISASDLLGHIREEPFSLYKVLAKRIEKQGALTPMPEFQPVVTSLQNTLESREVLSTITDCDPRLGILHNHALIQLFSITFKFKITNHADYPHVPPYNEPYPYIPTIMAIVNALAFLDTYTRAQSQDVSKLYHSDRYFYHLYHMHHLPSLKNGKPIYLPVLGELYLRDFIKLRPIPLGLIGVEPAQAIFADAYLNSPLDFFVHDLNHTRRLDSYNQRAWKMDKPLHKMAENYHFVIYHILPALEITVVDTLQERIIKKLALVLFFELFHEYAFAVEKTQLKFAFDFNSGDPSPFEHMVDDTFKESELEKLRMTNRNLQSGFSFFRQHTKAPLNRYFMDKGPNFIASCLNKLRGNFYDNPLKRSWTLPSMEHRTPENLAKAALTVADICFQGQHSYTYETLLKKASDTSYLEVYPK